MVGDDDYRLNLLLLMWYLQSGSVKEVSNRRVFPILVLDLAELDEFD